MNFIALIIGVIALVAVLLVWRIVRRPLLTTTVALVGFMVVWIAASGWMWIFWIALGIFGILLLIGLFKPLAVTGLFRFVTIGCVALIVIGAVAGSNIGGVREETAQATTASANPTPTPTPTIDMAALAQCRVDAITAYMTEQGFADGDYVVGEERIDTSLSEFSRQGSLGFRQGDTLPENREQLAELFASTDENVKLAVDAQVRKFPDIERETLLDVNIGKSSKRRCPRLLRETRA